MPSTDTGLRNLKPGEKPFKKFDSKGLFILVTPSGAKLWLVVDLPSRVSEQSCDPTTAVMTLLARQFDHVGHQAVFVSTANWQPSLC